MQQAGCGGTPESLYAELWISLASLLRSYTALHGLSGSCQATVEADDERILASHANRWLKLTRTGAAILWEQSGGVRGELEMTEAGRLRGASGEEEMDMAAETWARELMQ